MIQRRDPLLFLAAILTITSAATVHAQDEPRLYLGATNKLDTRRLQQDGLREDALRNRLEVTGTYGLFEAWVRLETLQISDANVYDPFGVGTGNPDGEDRIDQTEVSRRYFQIRDDSFTATVGDWAHIFGRGLALSVFEDEALNFDTRLEGLRGVLDRDRFDAIALAGSNEGNRFRGVFFDATPLKFVRVGGSVVEAWGSGEDTSIRAREQHLDALGQLSFGPLTAYGEYLVREFAGRNEQGEEKTPGHGAYTSLLFAIPYFTLSAEFRDYFKFAHEYHDPPTSLKQHTWTLLNRQSAQVVQDIQNVDSKGFLGEGILSFGLFTTFQGSFSKIVSDLDDDSYWEGYGEGKVGFFDKIFLTAGGTESEFRFGTTFEERIGGFGEFVLDFDFTNSLTFNAEFLDVRETDSVTQDYEEPIEYYDGIFSVSYGRSPWLNLTGIYERSTDPTEAKDEWFTAFAEIQIGGNHNLSLSYGSERGGWKCNGGICFFEPEFEGFKVNWIMRY